MSGRVKTIAILTHPRQGLNPNDFLGRCLHYHWAREPCLRVLVHRGIVSSLIGRAPLVKWYPEILRLPPHHDVPESLWRRRQELGIEFGKIDYILHEGEAIVLDANPTPYSALQVPNGRHLWMTGIMAAGIDFVGDGERWASLRPSPS